MKPFVKWAGGKKQLLDSLKKYMPKQFNRYYEPFVGGGALLFYVKPDNFVINDFNEELICAYKCFTNDDKFQLMIQELKKHELNHSEEYFYSIRKMDRDDNFSSLPDYVRAARMIYLNKACFNGLYRVSNSGFFNTPSGHRNSVTCINEKNFDEIRNYFKNTNYVILSGDYSEAIDDITPGDFVFFDPPYDKMDGKKETFTSYSTGIFKEDEQRRLASKFKELSDKGVLCMTTNHNTPLINELYKDYYIHVINVRRVFSADPEKRGIVQEVIITNYDTPKTEENIEKTIDEIEFPISGNN